MKTKIVMMTVVLLMSVHPVMAAPIPKRVIAEAVEAALRKGGREAVEPAARRAAMEAGEQIARRHGRAGLRLLADGGMDAVQVLARYGDDAARIGNGLSPAARRVLVTNADSLIPLGRRLGAEAVEQAAKSPHTAVRLLGRYGDDVGMRVLRHTPAEDLPRVLRYLDAADSPATREAFLQAYRKEGPSIFQRIPPSLVFVSGLSTSMIVGTVRATEPMVEIGNKIAELEPEYVMEEAMEFMKQAHSQTLLIIGAVLLLLLWRPLRRKREWQPKRVVSPIEVQNSPEGEPR